MFSRSSTSHGTEHGHRYPKRGPTAVCGPVKALRGSTKDVAENVMLVDLVRNDLGRVAILGTVPVSELLRDRSAPRCVAPRFNGSRRIAERYDIGGTSSSVVSSGVGNGLPEDSLRRGGKAHQRSSRGAAHHGTCTDLLPDPNLSDLDRHPSGRRNRRMSAQSPTDTSAGACSPYWGTRLIDTGKSVQPTAPISARRSYSEAPPQIPNPSRASSA